MFTKCLGEEVMDKWTKEFVTAAQKCYSRDFDPTLKPVYIRPYPIYSKYEEVKQELTNNMGYQQRPMMMNNMMPYNQMQQQYQYQQPQGFPVNQYQQMPQMYRQQSQNYQQQMPFYGPGQQFVNNRLNNRQKRQTKPGNKVVSDKPAVAGEAELYYWGKMKEMMKTKIGNFSCVMHEMGYFTADNQPNLQEYRAAYNNIKTLDPAMKKDFLENIDICDEVAKCMPERCFAKYPYGKEYGRSMFFVMCEKKKAAEVCLKKQMVDDYYKYKNLMKGGEAVDMSEFEDDPFEMMGF